MILTVTTLGEVAEKVIPKVPGKSIWGVKHPGDNIGISTLSFFCTYFILEYYLYHTI